MPLAIVPLIRLRLLLLLSFTSAPLEIPDDAGAENDLTSARGDGVGDTTAGAAPCTFHGFVIRPCRSPLQQLSSSSSEPMPDRDDA
jgi:hypothetical protein